MGYRNSLLAAPQRYVSAVRKGLEDSMRDAESAEATQRIPQTRTPLFLIVGKDVLQSAVVGFWLAGTNEAYFFGFSGRSYADALRANRWLFFTVVIIEDLILVAVDIETDLREVNLIAKVVGVAKLVLRTLPAFWKLKLNLAG